MKQLQKSQENCENFLQKILKCKKNKTISYKWVKNSKKQKKINIYKLQKNVKTKNDYKCKNTTKVQIFLENIKNINKKTFKKL